MHMANGCCFHDADIKTPMMHVPYLGGSLRANFNIKLFHASSRLVFSLHAQRIRSSLNSNYHSSSAMRTLSMTMFFYVLEGILIIIIKTHEFILALLIARKHIARQSVMNAPDLFVMTGLSARQCNAGISVYPWAHKTAVELQPCDF